MKTTKNIRVSEGTYQVLVELKRDAMRVHGESASFDEVISDLFMFLEHKQEQRDNEK